MITQRHPVLARKGSLTLLGVRVGRLALGRVPLDGVIRSARFGGWEGKTLAELSCLCLAHVDLLTYRLGMRIYFIATLKRASSDSFRPDLLRRSLLRAKRILTSLPENTEPDAEYLPFLLGRCTDRGYVDPYRLTTSLLDRRAVPAVRLLNSVYL